MKNPRRRDGRTEKSLRSNGRSLLGRVLRAESLEQRQLLAGDVVTSPHHNSWHAFDVNNDLRVTPTDALVVLNDLNRSGVRELNGESPSPSKFIDVNGDDLELRATLTQPDRIRRSLAVGDQLYLAGNLLVSSVDVSRRPQPWTSASLVVGDPNAPVVCLDEGEDRLCEAPERCDPAMR